MKVLFFLFFAFSISLPAQTATLRGQVTDESGAFVPGGKITSPFLGQANQPAGVGGALFSESVDNCRLELQTRFTF